MDITQRIPLDHDKALTTTQVAHRLKSRYGRRLSIGQVQRYCGKGIVIKDVCLVLPSVWSHRGRLIMPEWLAWWQAERQRLLTPEPIQVRSPRAASKAHARAVKELQAMGMQVG